MDIMVLFSISGPPNITLSVVNPAFVDVASLAPENIYKKKTVFLRQNVAEELQNSHDSPSLRVQKLDDSGNYICEAILLRCGSHNAYTLVDIDDQTRLENQPFLEEFNDNEEPDIDYDNVELVIEGWEYKPEIDPTRRDKLVSFTMRPPAPQLAKPEKPVYAISPQSEKDPLSFLLSRYYNTLYSLTTPLSYFPKTALTRFKNMCGNDVALIKSNLLSVYLTSEQLEERFKTKFGDVFNTEKVMSGSKYEVENGTLFVERHLEDLNNEEKTRKLVLELKVREAQLQILVLMELMLVWPIDETFLEESLKQKPKTQRQSLVRRRGSKKKIIPTFLGVGVQESSPEKPATKAVNEITLYTSLVTLVDLMSIWDTLLGRIKGEKDESMYGFLAYVLVPFFNKQLPHIVLFIIRKVKELRPKLKRKKSKKEQKEDEAEMQKPDSTATKTSRFAKVLLSPNLQPLLRRAATAGAELQPAFLLKRSKSNLGTKNLKKRQVDMSITSSTDDDMKRSKLFLFGDARRIKSVTSGVQGGVAPMKPSSSMRKTRTLPTSQVLATPSNARVVDIHQEIIKNPAALPHRGPSLVEQFAKIKENDTLTKITSSPVRESVESTPIFLHPIDSSPQVNSSPVMTRKKPGEPITLGESPFFTLNGLPPAKSGPFSARLIRKEPVKEHAFAERSMDDHLSFEGGDTESDSDSDFEKLLSAKPVIRKYFRK